MNFINKLIEFLKNVANDQRIPEKDKKIILALIALVISPIDLIPDWIPIFGQIDDFIILCLIADYFFSVLDDEVLLSHYPWDMKSFVKTKKMAKFLSLFVPHNLKKKIWTYVGSPY